MRTTRRRTLGCDIGAARVVMMTSSSLPGSRASGRTDDDRSVGIALWMGLVIGVVMPRIAAGCVAAGLSITRLGYPSDGFQRSSRQKIARPVPSYHDD